MTYVQAMSFSDLVTEVENLRFNSAQSTQIQRWINDRYAALWNADEWTFKYGQATGLTTTANSTVLGNLPSDFGMSLGIWRDDGYPVLYVPPRDFFNTWAASTQTGSPQQFTVINQAITLGPAAMDSLNTYSMVYEKRLTPLVNDADLPAIPSQHHYLLVTGALSMGLRLYNDFTWEFQEQAWQTGIQEMRQEWLNDQRGENTVWGRDEVEALPTAWGV